MYDVAVEYRAGERGGKDLKWQTARRIAGSALPAATGCETVTIGERQRHLSRRVQGPAPLASHVITEARRLSYATVAPVERVSPLSSAEQRRITKYTKHHFEQPQNEASSDCVHLRTASSSLSLPANVGGHPVASHFNAVKRSTVPATPGTHWLSYILPAALGYTGCGANTWTAGGAASDAVLLAGTKAAPIQPRASRPSGTPQASTWHAAVPKGTATTAATEKCTSGGSAGIRMQTSSPHGVCGSNASVVGSGTHAKACVTKYHSHASGAGNQKDGDTWGNTSRGITGATDGDASGYSESMEQRRGRHRQSVQQSANQQTVASLSSPLPSSSPWIVSKRSTTERPACAPTTTAALGKAALRKTATAPHLEIPPCSHQHHEKLETLHRKEKEEQPLYNQQRENPRIAVKQCIADIRAPALQHGTVLFCSYCGKRLVRRKHYMQCWPEYLLCDACTLLPPCSVCHRKALPAYIALQYTSPSCSVSQGNTTVKTCTNRRSSRLRCESCSSTSNTTGGADTRGSINASSGSSTSSRSPSASNSDTGSVQSTTDRSSAASSSQGTNAAAAGRGRQLRQTTRIRCEPLHDAEGLHLCGHCALLNPVNTKERLQRVTQYALLWLRERHGLVFSNERLSVQRTPVVQQRVRESLQWHDRLLRSASTPETLLLHTLQHSHEQPKLLTHCKGGEKLDSRLETECRRRTATRRLRIDPTERMRPALPQADQAATLSNCVAGTNAPTTPEAVTTNVEGMPGSDVNEAKILSESLQYLRLHPLQLLQAPKQGVAGDDLRPAAREHEQNCNVQQQQQTTERQGKYDQDDDKHLRMREIWPQQQNDQPQDKEKKDPRRPSEDGLGFAIEAVGYSELNAGKNSSVFGRCETERLLYDDLVQRLHLPGERDEQRHALDRAVHVSRSDASAATAASGGGVALRRISCKAEQTRHHPQPNCIQERIKRSLRCVRRVAVVRHLPETVFLSHLIHELVHAYIWCGQLPEEKTLLLQVEEGICNAVAASFLQDRLQKLTLWEAELAGTTASVTEKGNAVTGGAEGTAVREASAPATTLDEPRWRQAGAGVISVVAECKASKNYLRAAPAGEAAPDAHAAGDLHGKGNGELQEETDGNTEKRRELLLLLLRYEARIIRTRLGEMETDEHYCYGEGYRVMRRVMQDLQLQQTLRVVARHGYSLESVKRAAASVRFDEARNKGADTPAPPIEIRTASSGSASSTSKGDVNIQGRLPQQTSRHCLASEQATLVAIPAARIESNGKNRALGDTRQQARDPQETKCALRLDKASTETGQSVRQQEVRQSDDRTRVQQEEQQERGLLMRTRQTGQDRHAFTCARPLWDRAQRRPAGSQPSRAGAVRLGTRTVAAEVLGVVSTLFWQRTATTEREGFQRSATACSVVTGSG